MSAPPTERLDMLRSSLEELPRVSADVEERHLEDSRAGAGEWSPREVLVHLADAELVYGARIRMVVAGDSPRLEGYDQNRFAARFSELDTLPTALERWRVLREATLRLLDSLTADEWARTGLHPERGVESVARQVEIMAEHDRGHLAQLLAFVEG